MWYGKEEPGKVVRSEKFNVKNRGKKKEQVTKEIESKRSIEENEGIRIEGRGDCKKVG